MYRSASPAKNFFGCLAGKTFRPVYPPDDGSDIAGKEIVVLVHGLFHRGIVLLPLARFFTARGSAAAVFDYQTTRGRVADHGLELAQFLRELLEKYPENRISFVAHSMGGLVVRAALGHLTIPPERRGGIVFLGVPHRGSRVANLARRIVPFSDRLVETLPDLDSAPGGAVRSLSVPVQMPFGSISAASDFLVSLRSSCLRGESDHAIHRGIHAFLIFSRSVFEAAEHFLKNGSFD